MEMKTYQKKVIADLTRYLELLSQTGRMAAAYQLLWEEKNVPVGFGGLPRYQDILPGVPNLCFKVPTGGGKTFLAANAVKPIFDALPAMKARVVVWLVPSDAILVQTLGALKNPDHPYRQKIDVDFGSRVEVYTKQELLNGQNFNMTAVSEQLSIMVLSYDSFRGRKEALKAKRENSNLAPMAKALGTPENPIEDADETALLQIINQLSPLVIVDESHHARSNLSKEMLKNFNPCFVLDLTATPTRESNIVSFVDAVQLKGEHMVKLPVIVYNRDSQQEVLADAVDLRNRLEQQAQAEMEKTGLYIRPLVLFQAQPKGKEDRTTFTKLRDKLVDAGIPAEQIAIKTAEVNELKNIDLMRADCPIRYIITVNALKEGWDCPFAYILATLANKTSQVDVEQILGRILRQPHTRQHRQLALNMSYVLTSSSDFKTTLDGIIRGLNSAGFSNHDCRVVEAPELAAVPGSSERPPTAPLHTQETIRDPGSSAPEAFLSFDPGRLGQDLKLREQPGVTTSVAAMLDTAAKEQAAFETVLKATAVDHPFFGIPLEVQDKMTPIHMNEAFIAETKTLRLPQFFMTVSDSLFAEGYAVRLEKEHLAEGFSLKGKPYAIDFARADDEMAMVDINDHEGSTPKVYKMSKTDQLFFKEQFSQYSTDQKVKTCKDIIHRQLNKMDLVDAGELRYYVDMIVDQMDKETLAALEKSPQGFAVKIKKYVTGLLEEHNMAQFNRWLEVGRIICQPHYQLPEVIAPLHSTTTFGGSLYKAEEEVNGFEYELVMVLTGLTNIKWWHRNISRHGFFINGFVNHYPDFMVMTHSGKMVLIETKGDHLENRETKQKLALGRAWQNAAGPQYKYFMVFQSKDLQLDGAVPFDQFAELLKEL